MNRGAGILMPISSLPSKYGIGCFSKSAYDFVDLLDKGGQSYWQILPLGPTGYGDSPYQSFSAFAGNPYFISLEELIESGLLTKDECEKADLGDGNSYINYEKLYNNRFKLLRLAYERADLAEDTEFSDFCKINAHWLDDYALFMSLKEKFGGLPFSEWDESIRKRNPQCLEKHRSELKTEIGFQRFVQFLFYTQWAKLKAYANKKGLKIIGDIPIYTALDSVDVWASPELFELDENLTPTFVAGCPPDGFSADGQLWGNPLYQWDIHKKSGFAWWIKRMKHCFDMYDIVRIDHFRGFDEYYSIPYRDKNAKNGHWKKGPGLSLFKAIEKSLGLCPVIAEDLGFMTDSVRKLVKDSGFPSMKVLEFAFDSRDTGAKNDYLPHNYSKNCVAYTGTHDNQTLISWFESISKDEKNSVRDYLLDIYTPDQKINLPLIGLLLRSNADTCIIPIQDYLGLRDDARINTPSTLGENWKWRMCEDMLSDDLADLLLKSASAFGRQRNLGQTSKKI